MKKKNNLITEEYLDKRLEVTTEALLTEMDKREDGLEGRLIKEMDKRHNQVMTVLDSIVKELEIIREDRELAVYQTKQLQDVTAKHEKKITKLEKLQKTA